jgi:hypothetical protein
VRIPVRQVVFAIRGLFLADLGPRESVLDTIAKAAERVHFGNPDDESVALLANSIVRRKLDKRAIQYSEYRKWRGRNPSIFTTVMDGETLVGFFDLFPLKKEVGEALIDGTLDEHSITVDHIIPSGEMKRVSHLHIATIMSNDKQRTMTKIVANETLMIKFREFVETRYQNHRNITITAYAQSREGETLLRRNGFALCGFPGRNSLGCPLYVMRPPGSQTAIRRVSRILDGLLSRTERSAALRLLDSRIETVELRLRETIAKMFDDDVSKLPQEIATKIDDMVKRARKKNLVPRNTFDGSLRELLEMADLRELEKTIMSNWKLFDRIFGNRETATHRFDQLAELRNGIRHSRPINEITEKEGEAAILWFEILL